MCRELTKKYEEYIRGTLSTVRRHLQEQGCRGEFVILIGSSTDNETKRQVETDYIEVLRQLVTAGTDKKEAIRLTAERCGVPKRDVYKAALDL